MKACKQCSFHSFLCFQDGKFGRWADRILLKVSLQETWDQAAKWNSMGANKFSGMDFQPLLLVSIKMTVLMKTVIVLSHFQPQKRYSLAVWSLASCTTPLPWERWGLGSISRDSLEVGQVEKGKGTWESVGGEGGEEWPGRRA